MAAIRSKDTKPELILRRALWKNGLRFRKHYGKEKIDIAFPAQKLAVFVDGCFWHGCPLHGHIPKSNKDYWSAKIAKNIERDKRKNERLTAMGWSIFRVWEHELTELGEVVSQIKKCLRNKQKHDQYQYG